MFFFLLFFSPIKLFFIFTHQFSYFCSSDFLSHPVGQWWWEQVGLCICLAVGHSWSTHHNNKITLFKKKRGGGGRDKIWPFIICQSLQVLLGTLNIISYQGVQKVWMCKKENKTNKNTRTSFPTKNNRDRSSTLK